MSPKNDSELPTIIGTVEAENLADPLMELSDLFETMFDSPKEPVATLPENTLSYKMEPIGHIPEGPNKEYYTGAFVLDYCTDEANAVRATYQCADKSYKDEEDKNHTKHVVRLRVHSSQGMDGYDVANVDGDDYFQMMLSEINMDLQAEIEGSSYKINGAVHLRYSAPSKEVQPKDVWDNEGNLQQVIFEDGEIVTPKNDIERSNPLHWSNVRVGKDAQGNEHVCIIKDGELMHVEEYMSRAEAVLEEEDYRYDTLTFHIKDNEVFRVSGISTLLEDNPYLQTLTAQRLVKPTHVEPGSPLVNTFVYRGTEASTLIRSFFQTENDDGKLEGKETIDGLVEDLVKGNEIANTNLLCFEAIPYGFSKQTTKQWSREALHRAIEQAKKEREEDEN